MLHAWSGDRRADLPKALAELLLPLLRVTQAAIETVLQKNAGREMRFRQWQLIQHLQETAAALAGSGGGSVPASQIRRDVQAKSDAEVVAALRAARVRLPGVLLSTQDRQLCCAALQCQEHILEAGSTPNGLFEGQSQQLLSDLSGSNEFAAAAVQLLVPCCRNWYILEDNRRSDQQRKREKQQQQQSAQSAEAAGSSSSSSSKERLVPTKQLLASEVLVAPAHEEYPLNVYRLAMVFLDMLERQV
jgi:hypothetical protein